MPEGGSFLVDEGAVVRGEPIPRRGAARVQIPLYVLRAGRLRLHPEAFRVPRGVLETSREAAVVFDRCLQGLSREELWLLSMDDACRAVALVRVAVGDVDRVSAYSGVVASVALWAGEKSFLLGHNHPTGDPTPSPGDWIATRQLLDEAKSVGLELVDHVVVGDGVYVSMRSMNEPMFEEACEGLL